MNPLSFGGFSGHALQGATIPLKGGNAGPSRSFGGNTTYIQAPGGGPINAMPAAAASSGGMASIDWPMWALAAVAAYYVIQHK